MSVNRLINKELSYITKTPVLEMLGFGSRHLGSQGGRLGFIWYTRLVVCCLAVRVRWLKLGSWGLVVEVWWLKWSGSGGLPEIS